MTDEDTGRTSMSPEKRAEWEAQLSAMSATSEVFSGVGDPVLKSGEAPYHVSGEGLDLIRQQIEEEHENHFSGRCPTCGQACRCEMALFILIIKDRHADIEALPFLSLQAAIDEAKRRYGGEEDYREASLTPALYDDGWRYCADWSTEGETLRVVESKVQP